VPLSPSFRDDVDDAARAALLPVVVAEALAVGARRAALDAGEVERRWLPQPERGAELVASGVN
jgi:hypothetical protein